MPYIKQSDRPRFKYPLQELVNEICTNAELTYVLYAIVCQVLFRATIKNWDRRSDILKCLKSATHEFERNHVDWYEDTKKKENGDVYGE